MTSAAVAVRVHHGEVQRRTPLLVGAGGTALALLLTACTSAGPRAADPGEPSPSASGSAPAEPSTPEQPSPAEPAKPEATPTLRPRPVSLPALFEKDYNGGGLRIGRTLLETATYTEHYVTYRSGDLRISGILNVPRGRGPHPAVVLAHGYIDPAYYVNGQGLTRERGWLANAGFVTLHTDYRNHAGSSTAPRTDLTMRLGYTEDVVNAVLALRGTDQVRVDDDRIGLLGRSMGGGVVYNTLAAQPGLVDAGVAFAPVSSRAADNFNTFTRGDDDPGDDATATAILRRYGEPRDNPRFWREVSPRTYFDRVTEPVLIHHGSSDDTCPIRWSRATTRALEEAGADVRMRTYPGEEHAFGPQFALSMRRTVAFFRAHLRA
jgi:dipeptidyl aminopeptidase/acylaminoacyl peptidase